MQSIVGLKLCKLVFIAQLFACVLRICIAHKQHTHTHTHMDVRTHSNQLLPPALCFRSVDIAQTAALQGDALPAACALSQLSRLPSPTLAWFPHLLSRFALLPPALPHTMWIRNSVALFNFICFGRRRVYATHCNIEKFLCCHLRSALTVGFTARICEFLHPSTCPLLREGVTVCVWVSVSVCLLCWLFVFCIPLFSLTIFCVNCNKAIWQPTFPHTQTHSYFHVCMV